MRFFYRFRFFVARVCETTDKDTKIIPKLDE